MADLTEQSAQKMTLRLMVDPDRWLDAANANPAFRRCTTQVLADVVDRFALRAVDYEDAAEELGIKAQFVDLNRKIKKLKRAMWDGKMLQGESPIEVLQDLAAHCLLAIDMLDRPMEAAEPAPNDNVVADGPIGY